MIEIKVVKSDSIVFVSNDVYTNVVCTDIGLAPDIGVDYEYLQYSDSAWYECYYVDANNHLYELTDEQKTSLLDVVSNWVQPLGQEGNPTLEQAQLSKIESLNNSFTVDVSKITTALPHEMVSWRKQEDEARAYTADNTVATPFIDAQLITRDLGETKDELAAKIIINADTYQVSYATLLGKSQNLISKVSAAGTVEEVNLIVW